jgi:hypothetical protein
LLCVWIDSESTSDARKNGNRLQPAIAVDAQQPVEPSFLGRGSLAVMVFRRMNVWRGSNRPMRMRSEAAVVVLANSAISVDSVGVEVFKLLNRETSRKRSIARISSETPQAEAKES